MSGGVIRRSGRACRRGAALAAESVAGISKHINNIFIKLGLYPAEDANRRVLAVLTYLNA